MSTIPDRRLPRQQAASHADVTCDHFKPLPARDGLLTDLSNDKHPTRFWGFGWDNPARLRLEDAMTYFGFVQDGSVWLRRGPADSDHVYKLTRGMSFSCPGSCELQVGPGGKGIVIARIGYHGLFSFAGPLEEVGRFRYIDGGTTTLLVPPIRRGDPCVNHLHFPARSHQTMHMHPSFRFSVVFSGEGKCVVPATADGEGELLEIHLRPGCMFLIPTGSLHAIRTRESPMDIVTYHPNTVIGFDDDHHPMLDSTIIPKKTA